MNDGQAVYDSPLICQYLDALKNPGSLIVKENYWDILQWQALADGLMDASYQTVVEQRRPDQEQSEKWVKCWSDDIKRCLLVMQNQIEAIGTQTSLAHLSFATAISYIEFRLPQFIHEAGLEKLLIWYQLFKEQECMLATELG